MKTMTDKAPTLAELEAARVLLNRFAPNLYGKLPRDIFRYHPEAQPNWLEDEDHD